MTPKDPQFEPRTRENFARQAVMGTLGARLGGVAPGRVIIEMPFSAALTQQHGYLHAGIVTTALDSACGYAAFTLMPQKAEVLTVEFKSNFLNPAKGECFRFEGEVLKPGRRLMVTQGRAYAVAGGQDTLISVMTATMMVMEGGA